MSILLLMHEFEKVLAKNFRKDILICYQSMIMIRLYEIEIFISKSIYKSLVDLIWINILLKLNIVFSTTFHKFYEVHISSSIICYCTLIMQSLVLDIFIKVYVVIWDKKMMESSFFNNFFNDNYSVDLQAILDELI